MPQGYLGPLSGRSSVDFPRNAAGAVGLSFRDPESLLLRAVLGHAARPFMTMPRSVTALLSLFVLVSLGACRKSEPARPAPAQASNQASKAVDPVVQARRAFQTQLKDTP